MELYIGGYAQGKLEYVQAKYPKAGVYNENKFECISDIDLWNAAAGGFVGVDENISPKTIIWNHFHLAVKNMLRLGMTKEDILELILSMEPKMINLIIVCDEIGNGIVPMEKEERIWREETGRILCKIAEKATKVERIICGIPQIIK